MAHRQRASRGSSLREDVDSGLAELVRDTSRPDAWTLLLDGAPQSYVDLGDPTYLAFEYVRRLGHVIDLAAPAGQPLRVLHLGGGGLTLARYVAATRPRATQLAVEVDGALMDLVRRRLPLHRERLRVRIGDARDVVEKVRPGSFDVVVADVFGMGRTPAHVTSAEFVTAAARAVSAGGVFAMNIADGGRLGHARAQTATVATVFADVCLIAEPSVLRGRRFGNLVLAASRRGLPVAQLTRLAAADPFPGRLVHAADLTRFIAGAAPVSDAVARPSPPAPDSPFGWAGPPEPE